MTNIDTIQSDQTHAHAHIYICSFLFHFIFERAKERNKFAQITLKRVMSLTHFIFDLLIPFYYFFDIDATADDSFTLIFINSNTDLENTIISVRGTLSAQLGQ